MRTIILALFFAGCDAGTATVEADPAILEMAAQIDALQAQVDALLEDATVTEETAVPESGGPVDTDIDACVPRETPLLFHTTDRQIVIFGGVCSDSVEIVTVDARDAEFEAYDMESLGDDRWIGSVYVTTGKYRVRSTSADGEVTCYPGPSCDEGHYEVEYLPNDQPSDTGA